MGKLIVSTYTTLDGVIQPLDWLTEKQEPAARAERGSYVREQLFEADALVLGRETFEIFATVWPSRTAADDGPGEEGFNDRINAMPKYVASTTLHGSLDWNGTVLDQNVPAAVERLKQEYEGSLLMYGCGRLARTLLEHGLIDQCHFWIYPVVRGHGTRLFGDGTTIHMEQISARHFDSGFSIVTCEPRHAGHQP
jgi:dihydrofolate reductase